MINENNIYVIKNRLSNTKRMDPQGYFEFLCGSFMLKINTNHIMEPVSLNKNERITFYEKVDVSLYEKFNSQYDYINVWNDERLKNCTFLKYEDCDYYTMCKMPILNLCELIKYLYKLSNLKIFM